MASSKFKVGDKVISLYSDQEDSDNELEEYRVYTVLQVDRHGSSRYVMITLKELRPTSKWNEDLFIPATTLTCLLYGINYEA